MPFMGGVALVAGRYRTYGQQAFVVLMGPIWGSVLAVVSLGMYYATHQDFFLRASAWMGWLNMINLLPLSFMDGGQLMGTINYSINRTFGMVCHAVSTAITVVVLFFMNPLILLLIIIFGVPSVVKEIKNWYHTRNGDTWLVDESYLFQPKKLSVGQMFLIGGVWFTLATSLLFMIATISKMPGGNILGLFK
jgi:Zn-dependent protease